MNSTGLELTQADLIRNYLLMDLEQGRQTSAYKYYWRPMEVDFGQQAYVEYFDQFMRHYLTVRTGEIPKVSRVYESFKAYAQQSGAKNAEFELLMKDIRQMATYYVRIVLDKEKDAEIRSALRDLRDLKYDVADPFILSLYADFESELLSKADFIEILRMVESYMFRRAICEIPTNSMNKTFGSFAKAIDKTQYLDSVKAHFLLLPSYRRFPSDEEFEKRLGERNMYNSRNCGYCLRRLENFDKKEHISLDEYSIEHIMPQSVELSSAWVDDLGVEWKRVHAEKLHCLGNLTLTRYNSEYGKRSFIEKRDIPGGFRQSPVSLNLELRELDYWNEEEIDKRGRRLAKQALKIWSFPKLDDEFLKESRDKSSLNQTQNEHSISHFRYLDEGLKTRSLFDALRTEILALDQCVSEEILKHYVAYKAETNFVDVVPLSSKLRLTLNMPFTQLMDPKSLSIDMSGKGKLGNGDVIAELYSPEELQYVMTLVRQAFEYQMSLN
jgi:predicted transport protein